MKFIIASFLLITAFSTHASDTSAADSSLSILPIGQYHGKTDAGVDCSVIVNEVNYPDKVITVTAIDNRLKVFKIINEGVGFLFRPYKSEFIQTERYYVTSDRTSYVDNIIRTVSAGERSLYVTVAQERTVNRDFSVKAVECVVNY